MLVVVGVTGVGKSTLITALCRSGARWSELPGRRELTRRVILAGFGAAGETVPRLQRYEHVRAFHIRHPGGMAWILGGLEIDDRRFPDPLLFDGLRGTGEVRHAATCLPEARFLGLACPEALRLTRLLERTDVHDRDVSDAAPSEHRVEVTLGRLVSRGILTRSEVEDLQARLAKGDVAPADLLAKATILLEERTLYDPTSTTALLKALPPERSLALDSTLPVDQLVEQTMAWWNPPRGAEGSE